MTTQEINKAISTASGMFRNDFHCDLNAMHEAEKLLSDIQRDCYYYDYLHVKDEDHSWTVSAPAVKRAEAFLRAIGKWEESV